MKIFATICLAIICLNASAPDRFAALSRCESNDRDAAVGASGERGRYQTMEFVWKGATNIPFSMATNAATALAVAQAIQAGRTARFVALWKRQPTDAEWLLLWHRPATVLGGRKPTARELDRANRFAAICAKP